MVLTKLCNIKFYSKKNKNGFTLIEMILVVSIILVLATIAVPKFTASAKTAKVAKIQADIRTVSNAAAMYEFDNGAAPENIEGLTSAPNGKAYLEFVPKAPEGGSEYKLEKGVITCTFDGKTYASNAQPSDEKTNP